jgi:hypothetical protein
MVSLKTGGIEMERMTAPFPYKSALGDSKKWLKFF